MKFPFTLRLAYYSLRATVRAGLIFLLAWLMLIPASASEIAALGATNETRYPTGLRMMRVAQIIVTAAPPQAYDLIAMGVGPEVSPLMVRVAMTQMAAGNVLPETTKRSGEGKIESDRDIAGPRFIQVD